MPRTLRSLLANAPYLLLLALLAAVPPFLPNPYHVQVLVFIGIYVILALSLNLLNGYVGLLSIVNFSGQPVRVRTGPATDALAILDSVDAANNQIYLDTDLPPANFPNGTAVTVTLLTASRQFEADNVQAPGNQVVVKVDLPTDLAQNDVVRVRPPGTTSGGAVRRITAPPAVLAQLDRALPATHTTNLTVSRFAPVPNTLRNNASAPAVQIRFTITATPTIPGTNPYTMGDFLFLDGGEQMVRSV